MTDSSLHLQNTFQARTGLQGWRLALLTGGPRGLKSCNGAELGMGGSYQGFLYRLISALCGTELVSSRLVYSGGHGLVRSPFLPVMTEDCSFRKPV